MKEGFLEPRPSWPHAKAYVPTSAVLDTLLEDAPEDYVTLEWLMAGLQERSFGIVILLLGLLGLISGISAPAGILLSLVRGARRVALAVGVDPEGQWALADKCNRTAIAKYPDHTAEALAKRDEDVRRCLMANRLPSRTP